MKQVVFLLWGQGIAMSVANVFVVNSRQKVTRFAITSEVEKKLRSHSFSFISTY